MTEHQTSAAALRASEARFRSLIELVADFYWETDSEHRLTVIEANGVTQPEFSAASRLGRTRWEVPSVAPDAQGWRDHRARLEARLPFRHFEAAHQAPDGGVRYYMLAGEPFYDAQDVFQGYWGVGRDITERKRGEAALRESEERLSTTLNSIGDAVLTTDTEGRVSRMNPVAQQLTGWPFAEAQGRSVGEVFRIVNEQTRAPAVVPVIQVLATGEIQDLTSHAVLIARDGTEHPISDSAAPIRDAGGSVSGVVLVFRDVTAERQAERMIREQNELLEQRVRARTAELETTNQKLHSEISERQQAEQEIRDLNASLERRVSERTAQLEEANRAKSDFLANMSHELRTPLNAIIGFSEMLKDGVLGELEAKQKEFIGDIFGAGRHLLSLINDILDLSKVEAGMLQLDAGAVDVPALLKASTLIVREKASAHHIRLDTRLNPGLGTMRADERKLKQIVYNLLSNAVKFAPEGGTVTLSAHRCARAEVGFDETMPARILALPPGEHDEFLAITVEDSGVGIAEGDLQKLYQPFMQVDSSVARRHTGTGLGLSLVRRLAELHGGTVGVASRPGVGSRFSVWLPYREAASAEQEERPASDAAASAEPGATIASAHAGAASMRVAAPLALVIEDDDQVADLIAAQLHLDGYQVIRAATGEEGLVHAAKRRPQLITLDIFLPAMDGWEFLRHLKADARLADTPVVIISVADGLDHGLVLGARRVLQKPFTREELVTALAGLIEAPRSEGAPARVLVVDDNVKAVELVAGLIEREGYQALRAYGGAEAIETVRRARPDLVILDLMMPEVSGFEVARALRASEQTARIPILVLTAKDLTPEERARLNGAVSAILQKSDFSHDELLAELRRAIAVRKPD